MVARSRPLDAPNTPDEGLRIRLEGAYEVLQAAIGRFEHAATVLASSGWRKALLRQPDLLDELRRGEPAFGAANERAQVLASREPESAAAKLVERAARGRSELHRLLLRKLSAREAVTFEAAVTQLSWRLMAEVPGDLQPGERRVLEGGASQRVWLAAGLVFVLAQFAGLLVSATGGEQALVYFFAATLLLCLAFPIAMLMLSGSYVLTTRRLIWNPVRGSPVQVALSILKPGGMRLSRWFSWIRVDALEPFTMRGVQNAKALAAKAEILRWLAASGTGSTGSPIEVAVFPAFEGAELPAEDEGISGTAVMRPGYAAFFLAERGGAALAAITGNSPGSGVDLESALKLLRELPEVEFDRAIRAAAASAGLLFERPDSKVTSPGPVWQLLAVADGRRAFCAKIDWRYLADAETMVSHWRKG